MIENIIDYFVNNTYEFLFVLLTLNSILQLKVFKAPFDYDTSNHLYFAFLRYKKINFISSYDFGVKYFIPRLYAFMMPFIYKRIYLFRIANFITSNLLIVIFFFLKDQFQSDDVFILLILVFISNSGYINSLTSAAEFYEVVFIIFILIISIYIHNIYIGLAIMTIIVIFASFMLKMTFVLYGIAAIFLSGVYKENIFVSIVALIVYISTFYILLKLKNKSKVYSKTRRIFNPKNIRFIAGNPIFIFSLAAMALYNIYALPIELKILQIISIIILFGQKSYNTYFFQPVVVVTLALSYISGNPNENFTLLLKILTGIFGINSLAILFMSPKTINIFFRIFYMYDFGWKSHLQQIEIVVNYIKSNTNTNKYFYLWGSNVAILLYAKLKHVPNTFYNHNHLFYWSDIENKRQYAIDFIKKNKPDYIIESSIIKKNYFPVAELIEYEKIKSIYSTNIYKLKDKE